MCRDPFNLVISSYNYHTQRPQPENWLYRYKSLSPSTENAARYVRDPFYRLQTEGVSPEYLRLTPHSGRGAAKPSCGSAGKMGWFSGKSGCRFRPREKWVGWTIIATWRGKIGLSLGSLPRQPTWCQSVTAGLPRQPTWCQCVTPHPFRAFTNASLRTSRTPSGWCAQSSACTCKSLNVSPGVMGWCEVSFGALLP